MALNWFKNLFGNNEEKTKEQASEQKDQQSLKQENSNEQQVAQATEQVNDQISDQANDQALSTVEATANELEQDQALDNQVQIDKEQVDLVENNAIKEEPKLEQNTADIDKQEDTTSEPADKPAAQEHNFLAEQTPVKEKKGFFARLVSGLSKTGQNIGAGISALFVGKKINRDLFERLEENLLIADVGIDTTDKIIKNLTDHVKITQLNDAQALYEQLKVELKSIVEPCEKPLEIKDHKPFLILMIGVNGVGKTTTIGKLTKKLQQEGKSVILAAADTFRAAAIEQLQEWGDRNQVPVIAQKPGSDSAAVIYDAFNSAKSKGIDVVIADTAGRLSNKQHLLDELSKIVRVVQKLDPSAPHEVMITLDASTGQNAVGQVEAFNKAVPITGINLTKLDGTAKGGVIFAICDKFQKPIRYIGVGEKIDDLQPFNADEFINALFKE
ncbi:signal recognition particle-docking protein FtsY [Psittacicella hinzii]|uniref:Signal recognition particle receptor FtsY n=1 Tax=Psittacicella hinzii TaxID=2028575 RepID=A0A3A1YRN1_9GAMM|nr:signal recognition particle-docking protein FtsY [Psittacicella hinzii]RIY39590.1 signal recognition particle-docking protein FtsY [Psittacicella hinzii]